MGQPLPAAYVSDGRAASRTSGGVPLHVDGARLFNAAVALGTPGPRAARRPPTRPPSASPRASPARSGRSSWARATSSGARGGRARWSAAACARWASSPRPASSRCATDRPGMIERLAEDHVNARRLADGLAGMPGRRRAWTRRACAPTSSSSGVARPGCAFRAAHALAAEGVLMIAYPGGSRFAPSRTTASTRRTLTDRDRREPLRTCGGGRGSSPSHAVAVARRRRRHDRRDQRDAASRVARPADRGRPASRRAGRGRASTHARCAPARPRHVPGHPRPRRAAGRLSAAPPSLDDASSWSAHSWPTSRRSIRRRCRAVPRSSASWPCSRPARALRRRGAPRLGAPRVGER